MVSRVLVYSTISPTVRQLDVVLEAATDAGIEFYNFTRHGFRSFGGASYTEFLDLPSCIEHARQTANSPPESGDSNNNANRPDYESTGARLYCIESFKVFRNPDGPYACIEIDYRLVDLHGQTDARELDNPESLDTFSEFSCQYEQGVWYTEVTGRGW